jgi:hypothetical protein
MTSEWIILQRIIRMSVVAVIAVAGAWVAASWKLEPEPAFRQTKVYEKCLARGGSVVDCDAAMWMLAVEREMVR